MKIMSIIIVEMEGGETEEVKEKLKEDWTFDLHKNN